MKRIFKTRFGDRSGYVMPGDTKSGEYRGLTITARVESDPESSPHDLDAKGCCYDTNDPKYGTANKRILDAWDNDEWSYVGVVIDLERNGWSKQHAASLWGIDANFPRKRKVKWPNRYLDQVAEELAREALDTLARS